MNSEGESPVVNVTHTMGPAGPAVEHTARYELAHLRSSWWWFLALGILLVVCGTLAIIFPVVTVATSLLSVIVIAVVLMIAGAAMIVGAFWAGKWSGFLVQLLVGLLYLGAGFVVTERPVRSLLVITLFLAVSFMVMGAFRALAALTIRYPQWGWSVLNGVITLILGVIIYRHLRQDAFWVIGLLVGIEMLFNGLSWIMLSTAIRRIPKPA
jgi:uncharacterized membrane protein HdeD (DUF308 family)